MKKKVLRKQNSGHLCFVCGDRNAAGLHAAFYELEDGSLAGLVTARGVHQSYPGRVHGGVITALLDETIGRVITITEPESWGVTAEMSVRFKKPVPCDLPLLLVGRLLENNRRLYTAEGTLYLPDGTAAAVATARYRKLPLPQIADFAAAGEVWEALPAAGDPAEIELPDRR